MPCSEATLSSICCCTSLSSCWVAHTENPTAPPVISNMTIAATGKTTWNLNPLNTMAPSARAKQLALRLIENRTYRVSVVKPRLKK
jgi:hypothetical protein